MIILTGLLLFIVGIIGVAIFIDRKWKKINNNFQIPTNPHAKPGDSKNYLMGDNQYTDGLG
ncbi:hypothetical protein M3589_02240 [Heyndrickxia oleronia]|uniref:NADH dehydrogenase subunit 3 n=1 Tax=Heyndrickxia oleronia TaxID=38875 RepID=A0AAW6SU76_9BACI|nr:hypothetical protein [Heyndrickxia oleronia]MCM3236537.1 hypothetical protein [Heyndrickxia oleronia]MDH5159561.1 hypothetical protein [Heyndrickxia oleronia]